MWNGQLICAHTGGDNDDGLYWTTFDGSNWSADQSFGGNQSAAGPALVVQNGSLGCCHRGGGGDSSLWWTNFNGDSWQADQPFPNGNRSIDTPTVALFGGVLYCVHRGDGDDGLWYTTFDNEWQPDTRFDNGASSAGAVALAVVELP